MDVFQIITIEFDYNKPRDKYSETRETGQDLRFFFRILFSYMSMISSIRFNLSKECIFSSRRSSFSLRSDLMDSDSEECRLSILRRERIFSSRDLVRLISPLSRSLFLERPFLRYLMEILLPKYSPLGSSYCFVFSLNSRLAVLSSNLLLEETSVAFFCRPFLAFTGAGLLLTTRSRAELKRSAKEVSYFNLLSFLLGLFFKLAVDCLLRDECFCLDRLFSCRMRL